MMTTTYNDLTFDIASLTTRDVQIACSTAFPEEEDCWTAECMDAMRRAAGALLQSAQAARSGKRGAALEAITRRHGFLTAALMDITAAMAWADARRLLEGCYGDRRARMMLHIVASELFLAQPTYH